jgi:hypothetical protein
MAWYYVALALVVLATIAGVLIWWFFIRKKSSNSVTGVCTFVSGTAPTVIIPSGTTLPGPGWFYVSNLTQSPGVGGFSDSINPGVWVYAVNTKDNTPLTTPPTCASAPPTVPQGGTVPTLL